MPSDWQLQDAAAPCWVPAIFPVPARGRASLLWCGLRGCSCRAPLAEHSLVKELLISTAFFVICTSRKWNYFSFAHSNQIDSNFKPENARDLPRPLQLDRIQARISSSSTMTKNHISYIPFSTLLVIFLPGAWQEDYVLMPHYASDSGAAVPVMVAG